MCLRIDRQNADRKQTNNQDHRIVQISKLWQAAMPAQQVHQPDMEAEGPAPCVSRSSARVLCSVAFQK